MKKVIRLTESDLARLVKRVVKEQTNLLTAPIKQISKSLGLDNITDISGVHYIHYSVKKLPTGKFKIFVTTPKYKTPVDAASVFGQGSRWKEYSTQQEAQNVINSFGKGDFIDPLVPFKKVGKALGLPGIEEQTSNKKVIQLTESDLARLVKRVVKEQAQQNPLGQQGQSKGQGLVNFKVGDKLELATHVDVYEQSLDVQVKSIRGGFGAGVQGPASQKNSMELDCILITDAENIKMLDNLNPKLKKGDSLTLLITDVNAPLLAYWKLLKGGKPIVTPVAFDKRRYEVGGKLSDIKKINYI